MTKRNEKDVSMSRDEFNKYVATALMSGSKKIAYCKIEGNNFYGGMTDSLEDALEKCREYYKENSDADLCIGDYTGAVTIWDTKDILYELGYITQDEYNSYLMEQEAIV